MGVITEDDNESPLQMNRNLGKFVETLQFLKLYNNKMEKMLMDISFLAKSQIIDFDLMGRGLRKILLKKGDKKRNVEDYLGKILTSLKYRERSGYGSEPESEDYEFEIEEPSLIPKKVYKKELYELQVELLKLQEWLKDTGKTVIVPRLLYHYFGYEQKIIVTTPRQQTTSGAGEYAALCFDVPLFHVGPDGKYIKNPEIEKGKENRYPTGNKIISYKHGANKELFDTNLTKLLFTTDGTVKTMITSGDQDLKDYGGIVIDEVHERSVNIDIVIALVMDILNRRKDFKVIFMSATVNLDIFTNYFKRLGHGDNYNIYTVKEQKTTYDIKYIKEEKPLVKNANKLSDEVYNKIHARMLELETTKEIGDILAFVSSDSETIKLKLKLNKN